MLFKSIAALAAVAISAAAATSAHAATAYALTDTNTLLGFDTSSPTTLTSAVILKSAAVGGTAIEDLIGIDYRPSNATLYGVGRFGTIYTINPLTGVASAGASLSVALNGSRFGFDFNPVADRLRITSDSDQDLRIDVGTGVATVDGTLNPGNPTVTASAYTNDFAGSTATTLYDIDSVTNSLYIQNPPNNGTLTLVGSLGIDIASINGFDIYSAGGQNFAFAALLETGRSVSSLYSINLTTGFATPLGKIGGGDVIDGLAVVPAVVPEPTTLAAIAGIGALALRRRRQA